MVKSFLTFDEGGDICSPVWISVTISDRFSVNETRRSSRYFFLSKYTLPWFYGDNVSGNKKLHRVYTSNSKQHISDQYTNHY